MSTQVVRIANGDSIQVRTGVLRGSGPAGPPGPGNDISIGTVTEGQAASATVTGDSPNQVLNLVLPASNVPGPMGQINDFLTDVFTTSNQTVSTATDTTISFGSQASDELGMVVSATSFRPVASGLPDKVLTFNVRATFLNNGQNGTGFRRVWVLLNNSIVIGEGQSPAVVDSTEKTVVNAPVVWRFTENDTFSVRVRHSQGANVLTQCRLTGIRVGAGPAGPMGPPGQANTLSIGSVVTLSTGQPASASITGTAPNQVLSLGLPKGDQGPAGSAGSGYSAIHELDGTGGNTA
jgi:hypothetical protein